MESILLAMSHWALANAVGLAVSLVLLSARCGVGFGETMKELSWWLRTLFAVTLAAAVVSSLDLFEDRILTALLKVALLTALSIGGAFLLGVRLPRRRAS
jgi:hypothetical protein